MGQEAGKSAWPKPAGGYQTITGRRYGRRHAFVSFRPTSNQDRIPISQHDSSVLFHNICPALNDDSSLESTKPESPLCIGAVSEKEKDTSPFSMLQKNVKGQQISRMNSIPDDTTEDCEKVISKECTELHNQKGIAYVNIDSYEPESGEEGGDSSPSDFLSIAEEAGKLQKTLDGMLLKLEKEVISLNGLQSHLSILSHDEPRSGAEEKLPVPLTISSNLGMDSVQQNSKKIVPKRLSGAEGEMLVEINANSSNCEMQHTHMKAVWTPVELCNELNTTDCRVEQGNELVVRPKVRKQMSRSHLEKKKPRTVEEVGKDSTISWAENAEMQWGSPECIHQHNKEKMFTNDCAQKKAKNKAKQYLTLQEDKSFVDDNSFWEDFEDYSRNFSDSNKDEDSSEHSDGEWSASLLSYTAAEKDHSSSDESWETLPGKEEQEPELQSNSSSLEEDNSDFSFQAEDQTSLEEGEFPWLQYITKNESSSDEENDAVSQFVHPGFFMLDGNNNLEDDSCTSEDSDVEWRLFDEFGDGLGVAQAISYVDPQFLTYMALEERLTQAMETALAHLESLAVDVEQAHPPASKESIDSLPQIIIADDHNGQEQCCAICCSEYVKDEIITELPCRHLFHKPCVTLWLQKSGTCPVCRHVFAPILPEAAAAATSFLSDHDIPPSVRSDAGAR
uniref:RING-type E3 ubiquitin transferase n=1 Tax=Geotrypetes seraphini TaxID=260995 RepID=A0A6P8P703_GEOSA|nr:E3 ubiquitin-protein ligase Praja-2 [Geotrypetes seraphini]XP_033785032.1 E3 ubiquitin-protein ligase Praja-2 [Geotrypetes seraphini]XP_033785033.1 E3 ubiquitin-protein ligase Praja-2 [Geotrypetes seraphini]XP_033785034.1 E3 ubiquitin-protein ligase Praja-2 [Geotrypetes seraphini]XP_033785035.1 E3 ubiquitin-protein ligase Praja-2 [Geotrypetes seraphini]